jgi:hypothetical protein
VAAEKAVPVAVVDVAAEHEYSLDINSNRNGLFSRDSRPTNTKVLIAPASRF